MNERLLESMTCSLAADGFAPKIIRLENSAGMSIVLMDIGATWLSCELPVNAKKREVLLGIASMEDFYLQSSYMGATVGRYANRIAHGQFEIDGVPYTVSTNQAGNTLHGGELGFDKRRWSIDAQSAQHVIFSLASEDGDQGFPGNLKVTVCYQLTQDNQVKIEFNATTDKATPVNLTNHAYFNLLGAESEFDCKGHLLRIDADQYLPVNEVGIPIDKPVTVDATGFDFRTLKTVEYDFMVDSQQIPAKGYDHSFVLNTKCNLLETAAAKVISPDNLISMNVYTDKPALQLYTGNWLAGTPNRSGDNYRDYAGLALETQFLPNSPNHPEWEQTSCILRPNDEYNYTTIYEFEIHC